MSDEFDDDSTVDGTQATLVASTVATSTPAPGVHIGRYVVLFTTSGG
jgi:hypothetical protein